MTKKTNLSGWEDRLRCTVLKDVDHQADKVGYTIYKSYYPDFTLQTKDAIIYIEAKGRFWKGDQEKYLAVQQKLDDMNAINKKSMYGKKTYELVFLFQKPEVRVPNRKMTHAEWADKYGFRHFTEETIKGILK